MSGEPLPTTAATGEEPLPTTLADPEHLVQATSLLGGHRFGAGALVSRTFGTWRRNLAPFLLLSLVTYAPTIAASWYAFSDLLTARRFGAGGPSLEMLDLPERMLVFTGSWVLALVLHAIFAGAISYATFAHLSGRRASLGEMLRAGTRRVLPVMGTGLLMWLGIAGASLLLLVPGAMVACAWAVAIPATVVERRGVLASLSRSGDLTRGRRWAVLGGFLAVLGLLWVLTLVVQAVAMAVAVPLGKGPMAALLASQVASAAMAALPGVGMAVAYHDLRLEKEGGDTEQIVQVFS